MKEYTALSAEPYTPTSDESRADTEELTREEVRAMLTEEGTAFKVLAACNRAYGPYAGPMVQRLLHLDGKGRDRNDWIYKPEHEWEKEVGHTRWFQRKGRKAAIRAGVWEEEKRSIPAKNYYRLNIWKVWADVAPYLEGPQNGESISQAHKGASQVRHVKEPSKSGTYSDLTINRETSEETFKDSSVGSASASPHRNLNEVKSNTRTTDEDTAIPFVNIAGAPRPYDAKTVTEVLEFVLTQNDLVDELDADDVGRYKAEFKKLIRRGVTPEIMWSVLLRIIERWPQDGEGHQLYPHAAYGDVRKLPGMNGHEFQEHLRRFFTYGLADERDLRLLAAGYVPKVNVPKPDSEPYSATQDEDEEVDEEAVALLERANELIRDGRTASGLAFAEYYRAFTAPDAGEDGHEYVHEDVVNKALWLELTHEGWSRDMVADLYRDFRDLVTDMADERAKLADKLAEIAERRERELAEERERELAE